jgi:hypothetical protein
VARPLMSPKAMQARRDLALRLLADGESSIRAVAEIVEAHPSSVHAWHRAATEGGIASLVVFDRHGTEGVGWSEEDALERQAERAARRPRTGAKKVGRPRTRRPRTDCEAAAPRRRKRARRMGETLREHLGLPELPLQPARVAPVEEAAHHGWDTPALRTRITAILKNHPASVANGGLTLPQLRRILGDAYLDAYDAEMHEVVAMAQLFRAVMHRFGFTCAADGRWSNPL